MEKSRQSFRTALACFALLIAYVDARYCQIALAAGPTPDATAAAPRWVATGNLNTPRNSHTATLLANGDVLVAGGIGDSINPLVVVGGAELYDVATGTWRVTGSLGTARHSHTATLLSNGKVLVAGVQTASGSLATAELYDPGTGAWSPTGSLAKAHAGHTATLLPSGKVLVVGGYTEDFSLLNVAELYDPATGTWGPAGSPSFARSAHTATLLPNGSVLVAGGIVGTYDPDIQFPAASNAEVYDPVAGTWRQTGAALLAYGHAATLLANGKVLIAGGVSSVGCPPPAGCAGISMRVAQLYDPATEKWSQTGTLNEGGSFKTASLLPDGKVLLVGGSNLAELYDAGTGLWNSTSTLNVGRLQHTATLLPSGNVLVAGGRGAAIALASAELYGIGPIPSAIIGPGFSGVWYDPAQNGHGLVLEVLTDNRVLAAWFTFDPAGTQQAWFIGVGTYTGDTASLAAVDMPSGGRWITNAGPVVHNAWGTLSLKFIDCDHGKVDFNSVLGYGSGSMNLTRLTLPAGLSCP